MNIISRFDNKIISLMNINIRRNKYLDIFMSQVTKLGNGGFIWGIISLGLIISRKYEFIGILTIVSMFLCTLIGEGVIKHIVRRKRPFFYNKNLVVLIYKPKTYSFPSGHTSSSVAVAYILSIYFPQFALIVWLLAFLIGFSRIYLCVHYPSDVIIGAILGMICSFFTLILFRVI